MRLVLQLSSGSPQLAEAEAAALYPGLQRHGLVATAEGSPKLLCRLVLTRFAGKLIAEASALEKLKLPPYKSFAIRVSRVGGSEPSSDIIRAIAPKIRGKVNLESPAKVIRIFTDGRKYWATEQLYEYREKSLAVRDVNARLAFHPTSLQPKYARLLVNLSGVAHGKILDPFCGVGGIVLEAAEMGLRADGVEISERYAEGARENAWFYRLEKRIRVDNADFLSWKGGHYDAIVTDLPYGKSSGLFGRKLDSLYSKAFVKMKSHSSKLVAMAQKDLTPMLREAGWHVQQKFDFYVHRSMRRHIHVCSL